MTPSLKQQCERLAEEFVSERYNVSGGPEHYRTYQAGFTAAVPLVQAECEKNIEAMLIEAAKRGGDLVLKREREKSAKLLEALKELRYGWTIHDDNCGHVESSLHKALNKADKVIAEYEK